MAGGKILVSGMECYYDESLSTGGRATGDPDAWGGVWRPADAGQHGERVATAAGRVAARRQAAARVPGSGPHVQRPAPWPHGTHAQAGAVPGSGARGGLP